MACGFAMPWRARRSVPAALSRTPRSIIDSTTVVFNGDVLTSLDLSAVIAHHRERRAVATLVLTPVENPSAYGLVETGPDGWVQRFIEKPGPDEITCNTINAGIYVLEPSVLRYMPKGEAYSFERGLFPTLLENKEPVLSFILDRYWIDIGTPAKYLEVHHDILARKVRILPGCTKRARPLVAAGWEQWSMINRSSMPT